MLISVLGWYVGTVDSEIRNTRSAVYWTARGADPRQISVHVENMSRTASLKQFDIILACDQPPTPATAQTTRRRIEVTPPTLPIRQVLEPLREANKVGANVSLAPGGRIGLHATLYECRSLPEFRYQPNDAEPFRMIAAGSLNGLVLRHYSNLLLIAFALLAAGFIFWVVKGGIASLKGKDDVEDKQAGESYDVRVSVVPGPEPAPGAGGALDHPHRPG